MMFFVIMAFFDVSVYNYLEYVPSRSFKKVHLLFEKGARCPQTLNCHDQFQDGVLLRI